MPTFRNLIYCLPVPIAQSCVNFNSKHATQADTFLGSVHLKTDLHEVKKYLDSSKKCSLAEAVALICSYRGSFIFSPWHANRNDSTQNINDEQLVSVFPQPLHKIYEELHQLQILIQRLVGSTGDNKHYVDAVKCVVADFIYNGIFALGLLMYKNTVVCYLFMQLFEVF